MVTKTVSLMVFALGALVFICVAGGEVGESSAAGGLAGVGLGLLGATFVDSARFRNDRA